MTPTLEARCLVRNPFAGRDAMADDVRNAMSDDLLVQQYIKEYNDVVASGTMYVRNFQWAVKLLDALTPAQIDAVFQRVPAVRDHYPGMFLTAMLEHAHQVSNQHYHIQSRSDVAHLATCIKPGKRRLHLDINGDVGDYLGEHQNCRIHVHGNVADNCARGSKSCVYVIDGSAGSALGRNAIRTRIVVKGDVADYWGMSNACRFEFHGRIGEMDVGNFGCVLRVPRQNYESALKRFGHDINVEALP